jgi:tripartite-type tricarboxylate transporter receptor subunit TctC
MRYDARRDFVPVAMLGNLPMTLLVNPSLPVHSVDDLVKLAKERPGKLTFDSWGIGSSSHVAMEVLKQERKFEMLHVPYTGAAPAIAAVAGGQVDAMMASLPTSEPQHVGGKIRIIGVTPVKRPAGSVALPEAGMPPGVAVWVGILAPAKTPPEIVNRLNREFKAILDDPQARAQLTKAGIEPAASVGSPQEFTKFFNESYDFWGKTVREAKISVELK